jgi:hypothetical protein
VIVAHGLNDQLAEFGGLWTSAGMLLWIAYYLILKHYTRDLVPPDMVSEVAPWWRPSSRVPARSVVTAPSAVG